MNDFTFTQFDSLTRAEIDNYTVELIPLEFDICDGYMEYRLSVYENSSNIAVWTDTVYELYHLSPESIIMERWSHITF